MSSAAYLLAATNEQYSEAALGLIGSDFQRNAILQVAQQLGVSAEAIAGAMAEENHAYSNGQLKNDALDQYALSGVSPAAFAIDVATLGLTAASIKNAVALLTTTRTHAELAADYVGARLNLTTCAR